MIIVLLVVLLVVGRLVAAIELSYNSGFAQINILCRLSSVDTVAAVCVVRPHFVKVERLGILRVLVAPLPVLSVDVGCAVIIINRTYKLVAFIPFVGSLVFCSVCFSASAFVIFLPVRQK